MSFFEKNAKWHGDDPVWGKSNLTSESFNNRLLRLEVLVECIAGELGIDLEELIPVIHGSRTQEDARGRLAKIDAERE
ncbi:MAG: hypothetical protein GX224_02780 [Thermoplasmatales archaeon]|nr:hypothetical protein [Thermoplasmatales archaeon]